MLLNLLASAMLVSSAGAAGFADVSVRPYFDGSPSVLRANSSVDQNMDFTGVIWIFDELPDISSSMQIRVNLQFSSNDVEYSNFWVQDFTSTQIIRYDGSNAFSSSDGGWIDSAFRTVTFNQNISDASLRAWVLANGVQYIPPSLGGQIVDVVGTGLGFVVNLGTALNSGFDAIFMDNDALTNVGSFAFVLLGLGISVGITKKCFNWITGRHGM